MQMADVNLINSASVTGNYGLNSLTFNSNTVVTKIITGIKIIKEVDKKEWRNGDLTYKITIQNNGADVFEDAVCVDVLDPNLVRLVENSVEENGINKNYIYEERSGKLTINLEKIASGATSVITFRVLQK